jgi:hypothetical protein
MAEMIQVFLFLLSYLLAKNILQRVFVVRKHLRCLWSLSSVEVEDEPRPVPQEGPKEVGLYLLVE